MPTYVKTTGSRGLHVYVPIVRGPTQKQVWEVSKTIALDVARRHPALLTAVYKKAARPAGRVLVDYNQNAWGRTLASVYSVRPRPRATVSTPVTWDEVARGVTIEDFRLDNVPARISRLGDLWAPLTTTRGRFDLARLALMSRARHGFASPSGRGCHRRARPPSGRWPAIHPTSGGVAAARAVARSHSSGRRHRERPCRCPG